jgi:hypothetical protein
MRTALVVLLATASYGCGVLGPGCLDRQQRGSVTSLSAVAPAGGLVAHRVWYATEGSQNDVRISWAGQHESGGPRLHVYATRTSCVEFTPPADNRPPEPGACESVGQTGSVLSADARPCARNGSCEPLPAELVQTSLLVTHGRGTPERLGSPPEYVLWVVGDAARDAGYAMAITWFFGPDC